MKKKPQERRDVKAIVAAMDVTDAERVASPGHYNVGDKVVCRGRILTVTALPDNESGRVTCRSEYGASGNYSPDNLKPVTPLDIKREKWRRAWHARAQKKRLEAFQAVETAVETDAGPDHYKGTGMQAIDVIEAFDLGFNLGNVCKYILRAGRKNGNTRLQDLQKARDYLDREIRKESNVSP
jgi:uncharacterized protein DUF3310